MIICRFHAEGIWLTRFCERSEVFLPPRCPWGLNYSASWSRHWDSPGSLLLFFFFLPKWMMPAGGYLASMLIANTQPELSRWNSNAWTCQDIDCNLTVWAYYEADYWRVVFNCFQVKWISSQFHKLVYYCCSVASWVGVCQIWEIWINLL